MYRVYCPPYVVFSESVELFCKKINVAADYWPVQSVSTIMIDCSYLVPAERVIMFLIEVMPTFTVNGIFHSVLEHVNFYMRLVVKFYVSVILGTILVTRVFPTNTAD